MKEVNFCQDTITNELEKKGANKPCHRCGEVSFVVVDEMSHFSLQTEMTSRKDTNSTLPVAFVICRNCGAVTPHALGAFDLIPEENKFKEED